MSQANTINEFIKTALSFCSVANTNAQKAKASRRSNYGNLRYSFVCQPAMVNGERAMYIEARHVSKDGRGTFRRATLTKSRDNFFFDFFLEQFQAFYVALHEHVGIVQQYKFLDGEGNVKPTILYKWNGQRKVRVSESLQLNENYHFVANGVNAEAIERMFKQLF